MAKILLIEDDRLNRDLFQECLELEGHDIISAENGLIGLQQAQKYAPDLILCDIMLPELDGYGVLLKLRQDPNTISIPFIFITAKTAKVEYRQGMELGADDYLTKPLTAEDLVAAVSTRLQRQVMLERCFAAKFKYPSETRLTNPVVEENSEFLFPSIPELKDVFDFIEANYQHEITLSDVAQAVGYSPAYLTNRVKHETGRTVNGWIIERRMAAARSLLQNTDWSVEQVATKAGYLNVSYFFRQFRQYQGTTPKAWREKNI
jgi:YesN/AraC family two-component response regulator